MSLSQGYCTRLLLITNLHIIALGYLEISFPIAPVLSITKRNSSCKISNETVAEIEILFKEKDNKSLEFLFVYYMDDDSTHKDHDWKLADPLLLERLAKDWISYLMSAFREKRPI